MEFKSFPGLFQLKSEFLHIYKYPTQQPIALGPCFHLWPILYYCYFWIMLGSVRASQVALVVKNPLGNASRCKKHKFDPWVGTIPWRRAWQPTPVSLPGESQGRRSLVGCLCGVEQSRTRLKLLSSSSSSIIIKNKGVFIVSLTTPTFTSPESYSFFTQLLQRDQILNILYLLYILWKQRNNTKKLGD